MNYWRLFILSTWVLSLVACSSADDPKQARALRAKTATGDIVIGAAWAWEGAKGQLWRGIELAVDEINASGGVLNRRIRIVKEDDESSLVKGRKVAQQFAENLDMVAVIGHQSSYVALPAAATYQAAGLVYLTPGASSYQLNDQGYDLVFRTAPSNRSIGAQMATYMAQKGYRRVILFYEKVKSNQDMANYFEQHAKDLNMTVVDRRSFPNGAQDFSSTIQNWNDLYRFDALFLAGDMPEGAAFVAQARKMGFTAPIISGDGLDTAQFITAAGDASEGVVLPETFVHDPSRPAYSRFYTLFTQKYQTPPRTNHARGYDAVHVIAQAIRQANSTEPDKIAKALHATRGWHGATGEFTFDDKGDIPDKPIGLKVIRDGKFETLKYSHAVLQPFGAISDSHHATLAPTTKEKP